MLIRSYNKRYISILSDSDLFTRLFLCKLIEGNDFFGFLLTIACDLHREESGGILNNRVQSDVIG